MTAASASTRRKAYVPGDRVPVSGVYQIKHRRHRLPHEATLLQGEFFPHCRYCRAEVRFKLLRSAERVEEDLDFSHHPGPVLVR